jgi:epoxyqueuosine reductase
MSDALAAALKLKAAALGFDLCRIASPQSIPDAGERLGDWLAAQRHGDMAWMETTRERRAGPRALWPQVRACIMLGVNYAPDVDPLAATRRRDVGAISVYARNRDYHDVIKGRLKQLGSWLVARAGGDVKAFVDTAPVMEKPLAAAAGLGWQGKHTNLVSREFGSWLFLGALFATAELAFDTAEADRCGSCRACLDACPTQAFPSPYQLDARRCVSYLTIEHKGPIPEAMREAIGNRIYGCDDCLAVCPWNKFAQGAREAKLVAPDWRDPPLADLAELDDAGFRARFSGSPVKRIGRDRFLRNVMIAVGNSGDAALAPAARARLDDESELVREAAQWALRRLDQA